MLWLHECVRVVHVSLDREVFAKLRALGIAPSGASTDAEFLRRVTLDVIGTLPAPEDVRKFLADSSPDKRSRTIDSLLAHSMHAALWATRFLDITGCDVNAMEGPADLTPRRARMWHDWFRRRVAENTPYDQIARGVLCATSRDGNDVVRWLECETARGFGHLGDGRQQLVVRIGGAPLRRAHHVEHGDEHERDEGEKDPPSPLRRTNRALREGGAF